MKTLTVIFALAVTVLAGCFGGDHSNIDKDHNKQCKENCHVIDGAAAAPPTVIVQPTPVIVHPAQPVVGKPVAAAASPTLNGYRNGEKHGRWVEDATTHPLFSALAAFPGAEEIATLSNGVLSIGTMEGYYVDGKRQGLWTARLNDGMTSDMTYVDGLQHGPMITRFADGTVIENFFVKGQARPNRVVWRKPDGKVLRGKKALRAFFRP